MVEQSNPQHQEELAQAWKARDEADGRLKIAHYYLAKKVKECADLNDKVLVHERQLAEMQIGLDKAYLRIKELQGHLDEARQHAIALQGQLAALRKFEDKYYQLQALWQRISGLLDDSQMERSSDGVLSMRANSSTPLEEKEIKLYPYQEEETFGHASSAPDLFDPPRPAKRFKQCLFE